MSYFAVQTYARSGRGALTEDPPVVCKTSDQAVRTARRLSLKKAGVVAFCRSTNEFDEYGTPEFLAVHGQVPEHLLEMIPAELTAVVTPKNPVADGPIDPVNLKLRGWTELL